MKVIIADDERLSRVQLANALHAIGMPVELAGEAADGEDLVRLVERHEPDIAIVDIRMPKLSGLEAIGACASRFPCMQWIVLSGFSEFAYAKEALSMGVSDYLLKPVRPEELEKAIRKAAEQARDFLLLRNKQFEHDMLSVFHGLASVEREEERAGREAFRYRGTVFIFDESRESGKWQAEFGAKIRADLQASIRPGIHHALIVLPSGDLACIVAWNRAGDGDVPDTLASCESAIAGRMAAEWKADAAVTAYRSRDCASVAALVAELNWIVRRAKLRAIGGLRRYRPAEALEERAQDAAAEEWSEWLVKLALAHRNREYLAYQHAWNGLARLRAASGTGEVLSKPEVRDFLHCTLGLSGDGTSTPESTLAELSRIGERLLEAEAEEKGAGSGLIEQIVAFVDEHYAEDIGIGQIADQFDVTPNYLSYLFRKETGATFMKYVTAKRLALAKELLADPNAQVQQVSRLVGYYSTRHFSKLFTESFGCYPSEYKKKFGHARLPDEKE